MAWQHTLRARWAALALREQRGLTLAAAALLALLAWSVLLAPALRTLASADSQSAKLGAVLERMQALQARAKLLQSKPAVAPPDSLRALQAAAALLGKGAAVQVIGDQATVTLKQISSPNLAPWFTPVSAAGLSPTEVHLQRSAAAGEPRGTAAGEPLWSGTLVFRLPVGAKPTP